jgi:predicted RNA-binding Zn ribbon-like protein
MHWVDFEDFRLPALFGGHPALDFCNTWAGWGEAPSPEREWLPTYDRLAAWSCHAGLLDASGLERLRRAARRDRDSAATVLVSARRLRSAIHDAALGGSDRALRTVTSAARDALAVSTLRRGEDGGIRWTFTPAAGLDLPRLAVAHAASELLTGPDVAHVRACPGDDCGWLFIDQRGRRRWCSMSACGNRAKVRRHAERQRA